MIYKKFIKPVYFELYVLYKLNWNIKLNWKLQYWKNDLKILVTWYNSFKAHTFFSFNISPMSHGASLVVLLFLHIHLHMRFRLLLVVQCADQILLRALLKYVGVCLHQSVPNVPQLQIVEHHSRPSKPLTRWLGLASHTAWLLLMYLYLYK